MNGLDADFCGADLTGASFTGADLSGAFLYEALIDDHTNFSRVCFDDDTVWPPGFEPEGPADGCDEEGFE